MGVREEEGLCLACCVYEGKYCMGVHITSPPTPNYPVR